MGYSRSLQAIVRVEQFLVTLAKSNGQVEFTHDNPVELAHLIRQGVRVAQKHIDKGEPYTTYAEILNKYIIRTRPNLVVADPREITPIQAVQAAMSGMVLRDVSGLLEIIGAAIKHKAPQMHFPNAKASRLPIDKLREWAFANNYNVVIGEDDSVALERSNG